MILGAKRIVGERANAATEWMNGKPTTTYDELVIYGSVQPFRPHEAELLPEGVKLSDAKWVFTKSELRVANERTQMAADRLTIAGEEFVVTSLPGEWDGVPLAHTAAVCVRIAPPAE